MTTQQLIQKEAREKRLCTGFRSVEWVLVLLLAWASVAMFLIPDFMRDPTPPFWLFFQNICPMWLVGFALGAVALAHTLGLLFTRCHCSDTDTGYRYPAWGSRLRLCGVWGQVGGWLALFVIFALFFLQARELPFASGMCGILCLVASAACHCASNEETRRHARATFTQLTQQYPDDSPSQLLRRLELYT